MLLADENIKTKHIFIFILLLQISTYYFTRKYIMTREFYIKLLGDRLTMDMIDTQMKISAKFALWGYIFIPVIILFQITFHALLIQFPLLLKLIDIPFKKLFRLSAFAILPFSLLNILKTYRIYQLPADNISQKALAFTPFSINSIINPGFYDKNVYQFLGSFHLFWLIWLFILYRGLSITKKVNKIDSVLYPLCIFLFIILLKYGLSSYLTKILG